MKPKFCPYCGKKTIMQAEPGEVPVPFVEQGEYDGETYACEGESEYFECDSCCLGFIPWTYQDLHQD